ncbi:MAG: bifunctional DNA-formamidopyrimidine glycosylase/DNA-(apurinic or apyrimidinic site) lyase [Gemmataceae bacterium]
MPELPEVETVVRDLRPLLLGRRIASISFGPSLLRRPWLRNWSRVLKGRHIRAVERRGKWIVVHVEDGQVLVIHLGMTGQLTVAPTRLPLNNHTHWIVVLDEGTDQLRFRDIRRFGSVSRMRDAAALNQFFESARLGPEPFEVEKPYWQQTLRRTDRCLKAVLLDQRVVAGVGNIYADESLFQARLHPARMACRLARADQERLRKAVTVVLQRAIERRGSSIRNYIGGSGLKGQYQEEFRVYGRTGRPCFRCRCAIERIRLAGRSTHFCPQCQFPIPSSKSRVRS